MSGFYVVYVRIFISILFFTMFAKSKHTCLMAEISFVFLTCLFIRAFFCIFFRSENLPDNFVLDGSKFQITIDEESLTRQTFIADEDANLIAYFYGLETSYWFRFA